MKICGHYKYIIAPSHLHNKMFVVVSFEAPHNGPLIPLPPDVVNQKFLSAFNYDVLRSVITNNLS